ncbi:MAG: hypothetical protein JOY69_01545, partial [Candidatus Eremiobacteraeota bacterium]|nr:hypothetical protein [Candidatus Eremiobacteraeota bacterium]
FEAKLRLDVGSELYRRLAPLGDNLREALVVSELTLIESPDGNDDVVSFELAPADGEKCQRCWKFRRLGTNPAHPAICAECAAVVTEIRGLEVP